MIHKLFGLTMLLTIPLVTFTTAKRCYDNYEYIDGFIFTVGGVSSLIFSLWLIIL